MSSEAWINISSITCKVVDLSYTLCLFVLEILNFLTVVKIIVYLFIISPIISFPACMCWMEFTETDALPVANLLPFPSKILLLHH